METFIRGILWHLGRQVATDIYRRPSLFGSVLKVVGAALVGLIGLMAFLVAIVAIFGNAT